jgi:hypothetical protein
MRIPRSACLIAALSLHLACSGGWAPAVPTDASQPSDAGPDVPSETVDQTTCPVGRESGAGKVAHESYLRAHPEATQLVYVQLRELASSVPACPDSADVGAPCPARDEALVERQRTNLQQVVCVLRDLGPPGQIRQPVALWYERPFRLTSGRPVPVATGFEVAALWPQIETLATHPLVERITPSPGKAAATGVMTLEPPGECPKELESPLSKLQMAEGIRGQGRRPVVIEMRDDGLLPPSIACADGTLCEEAINSLWERAILNTRHLTCVGRWLDTVLKEPPPPVNHYSARGSLVAPLIPPFSQSAMTVKSFGLGLTWEEALELARHPYIESIWTAPGLQIGSPPEGCPPDLTKPIPEVACTTVREPVDSKLEPAYRAKWEQSQSPQQVVILVRGGAKICPLPECPVHNQSCPDQERFISHWKAENEASQRCVRALIGELGGSSESEIPWLVDMVEAHLTWPQIQAVAAHPHVERIEPSSTGAPPP